MRLAGTGGASTSVGVLVLGELVVGGDYEWKSAQCREATRKKSDGRPRSSLLGCCVSQSRRT